MAVFASQSFFNELPSDLHPAVFSSFDYSRECSPCSSGRSSPGIPCSTLLTPPASPPRSPGSPVSFLDDSFDVYDISLLNTIDLELPSSTHVDSLLLPMEDSKPADCQLTAAAQQILTTLPNMDLHDETDPFADMDIFFSTMTPPATPCATPPPELELSLDLIQQSHLQQVMSLASESVEAKPAKHQNKMKAASAKRRGRRHNPVAAPCSFAAPAAPAPAPALAPVAVPAPAPVTVRPVAVCPINPMAAPITVPAVTPAAPETADFKAEGLSKRDSHNISERQRRKDLKKSFQTLRQNVPAIADNPSVHTGQILKEAIDYIAKLQEEERALLAAKNEIRARNGLC